MRKLTLLLALIGFLGVQGVFAQTSVTGTVTDADNGGTLPGVSVLVKGTSIGTVTDMDGKYSLQVPEDAAALQYSFVGMEPQEVAFTGQTTINVDMQASALKLDEVIVTALGVSRTKKSLGYSVEDIKADELTKTRPTNIVDALSGKISGVQVTSASGAVGASSRITIRGNSSFAGDNQPLFVIDGVPISNYATDMGVSGGEADYGNAAMDIDPENIESMSVLKGASASALYGSRALNGVILITTKKGGINKGGSKRIGVTYSYNVGFDNVSTLPDYQNKYGQGSSGSEYAYKQFNADPDNTPYSTYQEYAQNESFNYYNGIGGGVNDGTDESWGPRLDAGLSLDQFTSPYTLDGNGSPVYEATPWVSHPDNTKNFYQTGVNQTHNIAVDFGSDRANGRISYINSNIKGIIPNTDLKKNSFNFNGTYHLTDKLHASASANYVNNQSDNLAGQGYGANNVMQSIGGWFGRQVEMQPLEDNWNQLDPFGKPYTWSYNYHNNPYWTVNKNTNSRTRDRIFGNVNFTYDVADWVNVNFRSGTDYFAETRKNVIWNMSNESKTQGGSFVQSFRTNSETNIDLFANFDKQLTEDFRITGLVGANYRRSQFNFQSVEATELTVPNFFDISNAKGSALVDMSRNEKETNSVYASADADYKDFLFVGATIRNDWSSTLPQESWSYFYYSGNVGFIFTELIDIDDKFLSFGKVRASYAKVGGDTDPYRLYNYYQAEEDGPFTGVTQYHYLRSLMNADLKSETKKAMEFGLDLRFYHNRFGLDLTYYQERTYDQIMAVDVSTSTGFNSKWINAGELENKGIEISAYGEIFKKKGGFNWTTNIRWSKNKNTVTELYGDLKKLQLAYAWGVSTQARPGEEWGVMMGTDYVRDGNGNIVVDSRGRPKATALPEEIGNTTPDFNFGFTNSFEYKGVNLSIHIDGRKGGDIFSVTKMFGLYAGVLEATADGSIREDGVIAGQNVMTDETFVNEDGTPNTTEVSAASFFSTAYGLKKMSVIDGSFIKLREISLGYNLPKSLLAKTSFIAGVNLSVFARNVALLWVHESNDVRIDPETGFGVGNAGVGFEQYQLPPSRTIGFKVTVNF